MDAARKGSKRGTNITTFDRKTLLGGGQAETHCHGFCANWESTIIGGGYKEGGEDVSSPVRGWPSFQLYTTFSLFFCLVMIDLREICV